NSDFRHHYDGVGVAPNAFVDSEHGTIAPWLTLSRCGRMGRGRFWKWLSRVYRGRERIVTQVLDGSEDSPGGRSRAADGLTEPVSGLKCSASAEAGILAPADDGDRPDLRTTHPGRLLPPRSGTPG